jgi:gamma-glutamyltranspeptidase/glutathione hydrolase
MIRVKNSFLKGTLRFVLCIFLLLAQVVKLLAAPENAALVSAKNGMVASADGIATRVGVEILRRGGNAVDAAVAVGLALAVTWPAAGNIGGGGFMLIRKADGTAMAIDYREVAPSKANRNMYLDERGKLREDSPRLGPLAVGVPGTVAGLALALEKWGTLKWEEVIAPARMLAAEGFSVSETLSQRLKAAQEKLGKFPESRRIFLRSGRNYKAGEKWIQPELAATLKRLQQSGPRDFYTGKTAELIVRSMKEGGGLIGFEDLERYRPIERVPLRGSYRGFEILSMPPPSSGGGILLEMLNLLENYDLKNLKANPVAKYHLLIEVMRRAYRDRATYYGDPDFVKIPLATLTSKAYAQSLAVGIDPQRATPSNALSEEPFPAEESHETTHYTVADRWGNVVANTYTLNNGYGCGVTVPGAGFLLNDEMDDFATKAGEPNGFGLIQGDANSIQPFKRPLSSMTPTIVVHHGKPLLALGTQGGPTITTQVLQVIVNLLDFGMPLDLAIRAPRIHHQYLPDVVDYDQDGLEIGVIQALEKMGHTLKVDPGFPKMGDVEAVMRDEKNGGYLGSPDPRNPNARAVGYQ